MSSGRLLQGVEFLYENGYNIFSSTACSSLPVDIIEYLDGRGIDVNKFPSLVVIGSGGKRLWEAVHESPADPEHPVNHFTANILDQFIHHYLEDSEIVTLFPSQPPRFPIQTFAHWLGLAHPTPLGKNIHKEFGLWHAYRSAFLTTLDLPETSRDMFPSPCDTCEDKPCIKVCPSQAVGEIKETLADFDKVKCFTFRLQKDSICSDRCISRIACPIGREHKYTMPQMNHHYSRSRKSIIEKHNTNNQYGYVTVA